MINGSFVFGMDDDDETVFQRTVDWAIEHGLTTTTFHIQTPYPGTRLFARMEAAGRILTRDWDLYDTRHVIYRPARLTPDALKHGYDNAYRDFYRWSSIARGSLSHDSMKHQAKHFFYAAGWKKFEPLWDYVIRAQAAGDDDAAPRRRAVESYRSEQASERIGAWRSSPTRSRRRGPELCHHASASRSPAGSPSRRRGVDGTGPCIVLS